MSETAENLAPEAGAVAEVPVAKLWRARGLRPVPAREPVTASSSPAPRLGAEDQALLDVLRASFVDRWREALEDADPVAAPDIAERLWRETSSAWRVYSPRITKLLGDHEQTETALEERVIVGLRSARPRVQEYLPFLSPGARVYVSAFMRLLGEVLDGADEQLRVGLRGVLDGQWPDSPGFDRYMAFVHALGVTGLEPGIPDEVSTSLATAFWSSLRELLAGDDARAHADRALLEAVAEQARESHVFDARGADSHHETEGILTMIRKRAAELPLDVWGSLPADASETLDESIYGR